MTHYDPYLPPVPKARTMSSSSTATTTSVSSIPIKDLPASYESGIDRWDGPKGYETFKWSSPPIRSYEAGIDRWDGPTGYEGFVWEEGKKEQK